MLPAAHADASMSGRYSAGMATQVQRRTATKHAIVDATIALHLEHPTDEPSLDAVAERAGVAKSTVLYHFQSRLGLLEAVAQRLYADMGRRLSPLEQYTDARAFVRAFLLDGMNPSTRVFHRVGDQLVYATSSQGIGRGVRSVMQALEELGVTERLLTISAAVQMMSRQVAFGHLDETAIDAFLGELFDGSGALGRVPDSALDR